MKRKNVTREQNQTLILKSAHKLFRKYGYSKTTVLDIATDLGFSTGHVYKFFPSKTAVIEAYAGMRFEGIKVVLLQIMLGMQSASKKILKFAETIYWFHRDLFRNERQTYAILTLAFEGDWKCANDFGIFKFEQITNLIERGIRDKEFKPTNAAAEARILIDSLAWVLHPFLFQEIRPSQLGPRLKTQMGFLLRALK